MRVPPERGSARDVALDVPKFVSAHLGAQIPGPPTKASVVDELTGGRGARYSKYLGSLEWRNAIVLWVNVGGNDYKNVFKVDAGDKGGVSMSWYASKMYDESSPVVQRLLAAADDAATAATGKAKKAADAVLLMCRLPGEPYVCCGTLGYVSHVPGNRPLKFVWKLRDAPAMRGKPDFEELLTAAK